MSGIFYGVGIGPGDPELLTLKALRIIKSCPVIAAPRTKGGNMLALSVAQRVVDMEGKTIVPLCFPMKSDLKAQHENHCRIAERLTAYLAKGQDIAMLNIGDVSLYSSCTYIAAELAKRGFETKMCAGVPSFCAAAAELGIPLSEGSEPLTIIPAQYEGAQSMLSREGTKVIMKSGRRLSEIKEMLSGEEAVFAAENCGFPEQKLYRDKDGLRDCGYLTLMIVK